MVVVLRGDDFEAGGVVAVAAEVVFEGEDEFLFAPFGLVLFGGGVDEVLLGPAVLDWHLGDACVEDAVEL